MANFSDKFQDPRWVEKRDEILTRVNYECEYCHESGQNAQVYLSFYAKGREIWDQPVDAYKVYCPTHREMRQSLDTDLKEALAVFSIDELDSLQLALKELVAIPLHKRTASIERIYIAAKNERMNAPFIESDDEYDEHDE